MPLRYLIAHNHQRYNKVRISNFKIITSTMLNNTFHFYRALHLKHFQTTILLWTKTIMLRINRSASLLGICLLSFSAITAAYTVRGTPDCQEWQSDNSDRFWVMGYISGRNAALNETLTSGRDMDEVYQYVTQFCKANPKKDADDALQEYAQGAPVAATQASGASDGYKTISMIDLKLDIGSMLNQKIQTKTRLISFGGMLMLTDPNQTFDGNGILAEQEQMSRDDRAFILQQCGTGCDVTIQGEIKEVMLQTGVKLDRLVR